MEVLGRERRRRWSQAEKLEIVAAVGVNGETLARVARRYDVSRSQIYNWRHLFRKRGLPPAPVGPIFCRSTSARRCTRNPRSRATSAERVGITLLIRGCVGITISPANIDYTIHKLELCALGA
ncbi:transposase [Sphingobium sp. BS19]|uniref:transposase n=1 Tax=Sphingobium sp. BS19 TaxID=3018973 RepID=UPI0035D043E7